MLDAVVYRLEFPQLYAKEEILKLYHRVIEMVSYYFKKWEVGEETIAIIGFSEHKKWTPYAKVSGKKGGHPKKEFMHSEATMVMPHVHIYLSGLKSRKISEKIWETQGKYWRNHYPKMKFPTFKNFAYSVRHFPVRYVKEQSTYTRTFGDVDAYIEKHRIDNDQLGFGG